MDLFKLSTNICLVAILLFAVSCDQIQSVRQRVSKFLIGEIKLEKESNIETQEIVRQDETQLAEKENVSPNEQFKKYLDAYFLNPGKTIENKLMALLPKINWQDFNREKLQELYNRFIPFIENKDKSVIPFLLAWYQSMPVVYRDEMAKVWSLALDYMHEDFLKLYFQQLPEDKCKMLGSLNINKDKEITLAIINERLNIIKAIETEDLAFKRYLQLCHDQLGLLKYRVVNSL